MNNSQFSTHHRDHLLAIVSRFFCTECGFDLSDRLPKRIGETSQFGCPDCAMTYKLVLAGTTKVRVSGVGA